MYQNLAGSNLGACMSPWTDFIGNKHPPIALGMHANSKDFSAMQGLRKVQ